MWRFHPAVLTTKQSQKMWRLRKAYGAKVTANNRRNWMYRQPVKEEGFETIVLAIGAHKGMAIGVDYRERTECGRLP